jgi:CBS domain-containing protein
MQPGAEELLRLLNQIDERLKQRVRSHEGRGFMMRLDIAARADPVLARYKDDLREYSELRNAIVHYQGFPTEVLAEPTEEALQRLRRIVEQILDPPRLVPTFASSVRCFSADDPLLDALRFMNEQRHSQVPVQCAGQLALLSAEGIGRWLAANPEARAVATPVRDVLAYERPGTFEIKSGDTTLEDARVAFQQAVARGVRLRAILITKGATADGKLLGLVTAADLLEHQEKKPKPETRPRRRR